MNERRKFLKKLIITGASAYVAPAIWGAPVETGKTDKFGEILPTRPFGKTGENVTIYCMGGSHVAKADSDFESQAILEKGIELGVRFFDNAWTYDRGRAEELYGKYLIPTYRDAIFLMSKTKSYTAADAKKQLEDSLRRMKTDYLDLWQMHEVRTTEDVENRFNEHILEVMLEAQQKGIVRYLGFTGHMHTAAHKLVIEKVAGKDPFDCVQLPVNPLDAAKPDSFVKELIPTLVEKGYAILGMKSLAHGRFFANNKDNIKIEDPIIPNHLSLEEVIWYVLSQPITAIVSGTDKLEQVEQNVNIVKKFAKISIEEQRLLVEKVSKFANTPNLEYYRPDPSTY